MCHLCNPWDILMADLMFGFYLLLWIVALIWVMDLHMFVIYLSCVCVCDTLSWCEHGGVQQSSLKASASPRRQVRRVIPVLWFAVPSRPGPFRGNNSSAVWIAVNGLMVGTAVMATVMMPVPVAMVRVATVAIVAVSSTVYLEDDGTECDKKADADTAQKHQCCPLGLVCRKRGTLVFKNS